MTHDPTTPAGEREFCPACAAGHVPQMGIHMPDRPGDPDQFRCSNARATPTPESHE